MKIALVANTSWNIYNFRAGLLNYLLQKGYQLSVIAPQDEYSERIKDWHLSFYPIELENKGTNPIKDVKFYRSLLLLYEQISPDVVLHFTIKPNIYGTLACRKLKIPCINNVSGLGTTFIHKKITSKIAHLLYRFSFRFAHKVFFQNKEDLALFVKKKLVKEEKTGLLPGSGIDLNKFQPTKKLSSSNFTFLMIARLIYDKGIREYVEAASIVKKHFPEVIFQLIGGFEKSTKNPLNISPEEVTFWQGIVEYLGTQNDVRPYIASADVVVLPSYREGTPRSLLEAAAMAKPLLTTDVAGCREVVEDGKNGFLCQEKNAIDLAEKMICFLQTSPYILQEMGLYSRKKVERQFDEKFVFQAYQEAIEATMKAKR
ncbi:MAG: glycosyltransferase family 4 protein [Raineya sp.]